MTTNSVPMKETFDMHIRQLRKFKDSTLMEFPEKLNINFGNLYKIKVVKKLMKKDFDFSQTNLSLT